MNSYHNLIKCQEILEEIKVTQHHEISVNRKMVINGAMCENRLNLNKESTKVMLYHILRMLLFFVESIKIYLKNGCLID